MTRAEQRFAGARASARSTGETWPVDITNGELPSGGASRGRRVTGGREVSHTRSVDGHSSKEMCIRRHGRSGDWLLWLHSAAAPKGKEGRRRVLARCVERQVGRPQGRSRVEVR